MQQKYGLLESEWQDMHAALQRIKNHSELDLDLARKMFFWGAARTIEKVLHGHPLMATLLACEIRDYERPIKEELELYKGGMVQ